MVKVCQFLIHIECLLSLNIFFFFQRTPLHIAAEQSDVNTVKTLLDKGSDTTIKDKDGVLVTVAVP